MPHWEISPSAPWLKTLSDMFRAFVPKNIFYDLKALIEKHIDFAQIAEWQNKSSPALLIGAANVLTGEFKKFSSLRGEIQVETLLASAAVPEIFPAVIIGNNVYWDGLYSDNPPTDELLDVNYVGRQNMPDEIWIIQINPETRKNVPATIQDIIDRRNEMIGNESLFQDLKKIKMINRFLEKNAFTEEYRKKYRPIQIYKISMSRQLQDILDYATKLNRNRNFIHRLIEDGIQQGQAFLETQ
jgi:NTE family protein